MTTDTTDTTRNGRSPRRAGLLLILLGTAALLLGGWGSAQYRNALSRGPLLRDPQGIAVDASGRVYCGVAARRIHVYDPTGRIVRAWPLETDGAPLRLRLTPGGDGPVVEVAVQGAEAVLRYDAEGHPLAVRTDPDAFEAFGAAGEREVTAPDGVRHAFEGTALVRGAPGAIEVIVEPIPVPLRWVAGASWILVATFIVGAIAIFAGIVRSGRPGPHAERS